MRVGDDERMINYEWPYGEIGRLLKVRSREHTGISH